MTDPYRDARRDGWDAFEARWKQAGGVKQCYAEAFEAWQRHTSLLLVEAERAGREAGRAEERERIAREIEAERDGPGPRGIRAKHPPEQWWRHGMTFAAQIARGGS